MTADGSSDLHTRQMSRDDAQTIARLAAERDDLRRRLNIAEAALAISESLNESMRADNVRLREEARGHRNT